MNMGWRWPILWQGQIGPLGFSMEKFENVHFSVAVVVYDINEHSDWMPMKF